MPGRPINAYLQESLFFWVVTFLVLNASYFFFEYLIRKYPYLNQKRFISAAALLSLSLGGYFISAVTWISHFCFLLAVLAALYLPLCFPGQRNFYLTGRFLETAFWLLTALFFFVLQPVYNQLMFYLGGAAALSTGTYLLATVFFGLMFGRAGRRAEKEAYKFLPLFTLISGGLIVLFLTNEMITEVGLPLAFLIAASACFILFIQYLVEKFMITDEQTEFERVAKKFLQNRPETDSTAWEKYIGHYVRGGNLTDLGEALFDLAESGDWPRDNLWRALEPLIQNARFDPHYLFPLEKKRLVELKRDQRLEAVKECFNRLNMEVQ